MLLLLVKKHIWQLFLKKKKKPLNNLAKPKGSQVITIPGKRIPEFFFNK